MTNKEQLHIDSDFSDSYQNGFIQHDGYDVSPVFYHIKNIKWDLFLSLHFNHPNLFRDTEYAETQRWLFFKHLVKNTCKVLRIPRNDLQYFGTTEKQQQRCHLHALVYIKKKAPVSLEKVRANMQTLIEKDETVAFPTVCTICRTSLNKITGKCSKCKKGVSIRDKSSMERAIQIVKSPAEVAAYLSKFNKNDMDCIPIHHSKKFPEFLEDHGKYGI